MKITQNPTATHLGDGSYNIYNHHVTLELGKGETFEVEPEAFIAGSHVSCQTRNASSGFLNGLARIFFAGESLFTNTFTGLTTHRSWVSIAPSHLGQIASYKFKSTSDKIYLTSQSYLASSSNVHLSTKLDGFLDMKGMGNLLVKATPGNDFGYGPEQQVLFHSDAGSIIPISVTPENPVMVDNKHIIAFTGNDGELKCKYTLLSQGLTGFFASGEGYVCEFSGTGTIFIRSHEAPAQATKTRPATSTNGTSFR